MSVRTIMQWGTEMDGQHPPTPTWAQVKDELLKLDEEELLELAERLYHLDVDNKVFLFSRLGLGVPQTLVEPYRGAIRREFNPDRGEPRLHIGSARKALNDFKQACTDPRSVADLMLYYVEQCIACTAQYGDINAGFYDSLESVFLEAVTLIENTGDPQIAETFRPRLRRIVDQTQSIGWGVYDYLCEVFASEYPWAD